MNGIRYRVVSKYIGGVLMVLGGVFLAAFCASALLGEPLSNLLTYILLTAASLALGWELYRRVPERDVTPVEAATLAAASFLAASVIGAAPFYLIGGMGPVDSWFESMSGFTTTGLSLLDVRAAPGSLLFLRALSQWVGGMGFVVITVSVLLVSGKSAVGLVSLEVEEKLFPRIVRHVQVIAVTYGVLTLLSVTLLLLAGLGFFNALCYTLSGISTGGFAVHPESVAGLPGGLTFLAFMLVMLFGSINFLLYYRCLKEAGIKGGVVAFFKDPQVAALLVLSAGAGLVLGLVLDGGRGFVDGAFLALSAQTTTGYHTLSPAALPPFALALLIGSMFLGGSMGSTSGGVKLFRVITLARSANAFLAGHHYPEDMVPPGGRYGRGVDLKELPGIFYVIATYAVAVFAGTLVFVWAGYGPMESVFEVTSAIGTVGLSTGLAAPGLESGLKVLLTVLMWLGRIEFFPFFIWMYSLLALRRPFE